MLLSAAVAAAACLGLLWNKTARSVAWDWHYRLTGQSWRANGDMFAFEPFLESRSVPLVDQPVEDPESPTYLIRSGLEVKPHAVGLTYPVNMAFVPESSGSKAPFYYVAELHGAIKWVDRQGNVHLLAEDLLNFAPRQMRTSDEFGISGLALVPGTRDLIITSPLQNATSGQFENAIRRIYTADEGRRVERVETLLTLSGEPTSPANQIQQVHFGEDGKLYVSVGDAMNWVLARDPTKWGGKILRMNIDGTPCEDNPLFDPQPQPRAKSQNYIYALGLRNAFDFAFEPGSSRIWAGDVGLDLNRLVAIERGGDLGWDGTDDSFCREARHLFQDKFIPVGILFVKGDGLGQPLSGALLVAGYSTVNGPGPGRSKRIVSFEVADGRLISGPTGVVAYQGTGQSSFLGLAQGPDGLYFTDPFGEQTTGHAEGTGRVMRVAPSERTAALPVRDKPADWEDWSSVERGKYLFVYKGQCASCHTVERLSSGREGPNLSQAIPELRRRLSSDAYWQELQRNADARPANHQAAINEVQATAGTKRIRTWLRHHVLDPRFDNPRGKMPAFGAAKVFDEEELEALLDFVLSLE